MIKHYALKVDTQNLGASFIYFENDKLTLNQAQNRLKEYQIKFDNLKNNGITPTVPDTERDNKSYKITNMYLIPLNQPKELN
jgi:hypothetical protein